MRVENRAGRGSGGTETVCRAELLAPSHSVISMGDSLPESVVVCQQPAIQSKETWSRAPLPDTASGKTSRKET